MRAASVSPEVSVDASRVSDTVITAMRTGTKARAWARRCVVGGVVIVVVLVGVGRRRRRRGLNRRMIGRPGSVRDFVETGRGAVAAAVVHPVIGQEALDVGTGLGRAHAFDEHQRVVFLAVARGQPLRNLQRSGIVGGAQLDEVAVVAIEQLGDVALPK